MGVLRPKRRGVGDEVWEITGRSQTGSYRNVYVIAGL